MLSEWNGQLPTSRLRDSAANPCWIPHQALGAHVIGEGRAARWAGIICGTAPAARHNQWRGAPRGRRKERRGARQRRSGGRRSRRQGGSAARPERHGGIAKTPNAQPTAFSPQHVVLARPAAPLPAVGATWQPCHSSLPRLAGNIQGARRCAAAEGQRLRGWVLGSDSKKSMAFAA